VLPRGTRDADLSSDAPGALAGGAGPGREALGLRAEEELDLVLVDGVPLQGPQVGRRGSRRGPGPGGRGTPQRWRAEHGHGIAKRPWILNAAFGFTGMLLLERNGVITETRSGPGPLEGGKWGEIILPGRKEDLCEHDYYGEV